jgi:hypothetical protein
MERRSFIALAGTGLLGTGLLPNFSMGIESSKSNLRWVKNPDTNLFGQVICGGDPFVRDAASGVLNANCFLVNQGKRYQEISLKPGQEKIRGEQIKASLSHRLRKTSFGQGEDLLEATLTVRNLSNTIINLDVSFYTGAQSSDQFDLQQVYIPISAAGLFKDDRHASIGSLEFFTDCDHKIGSGSFECNYLEPMAANPSKRKTKALLLAPVVDSYYPEKQWRVSLFTDAEFPCEFNYKLDGRNNPLWTAGRQIVLNPSEEKTLKCFLLIHQGDSAVSWNVFQQFGYKDSSHVPHWLRKVKVHYYDFLSSANGEKGHRGDGYESDMQYFKEYHVGMATQHGYYPSIGDFIQPTRQKWLAMQGDKQGAVEMSISKMKARIEATRKVGTHPAVYMHTLCFDDASPSFGKLKDSILVNAQGQPIKYPWTNSDTAGQNWFMSFASKEWRDHLLKQAEYIMEILNPDAITLDETFLCLGYDEHPDRKGPLSAHSIPFMKELRELIHSYGKDKALLTSDCSMASMVFWADGEAGDHSYPNLLGNPLYRKEPIRYLAPLGKKPWIPCSWHFIQMWDAQMDLARKSGTGVGVANGYIEFNGLKNLPEPIASKIKKDIQSIDK